MQEGCQIHQLNVVLYYFVQQQGCQMQQLHIVSCRFALANLHSLLMRLTAFLEIFLGNSMESIPLSIILYVLIGSVPVKGGLVKIQQRLNNSRSRWVEPTCYGLCHGESHNF